MNRMNNDQNNKKKEYLNLYQKAIQREQEILDEIQFLRADQRFPVIANAGMPECLDAGDLIEYMELLEEQITLLKEERLERAKIRLKIENSIRLMKNEDEQRLLRLRYIKGLKWEDVAEEMAYSWRKIHYLHNEALENFEV